MAEKKLGIDKITAKDLKDNTAVMLLRSGDDLYVMGAELEPPRNDRTLYNGLIQLGNLVGSARRTLYFGVANRQGNLEEFMDNIKPQEDRDNGL